jgi:hypothetical protein
MSAPAQMITPLASALTIGEHVAINKTVKVNIVVARTV